MRPFVSILDDIILDSLPMYIIHNSIVFINKYLPPTNRWLILFSSIPVGLSCGTIFAFSIYSTDLAKKCNLTTSDSSSLNISMVVGTAFGGLIGGLVTDYYGTQLPMLLSSLCVFFGYRWLNGLYNIGTGSLVQLLLAMFLIGIGSTSGYFSAIKAVTLEFPKNKGTAQSITIASFAISSLLFSYISIHFFHENVGGFLSFLHISCGGMIFLGFLLIRVDGHYKPDEYQEVANAIPVDQGPLDHDPHTKSSLAHLNLQQSLLHPVFWYHFFIFAVIQGLGQMYIFDIGFILKAVYQYYPPANKNLSLSHLQALHVSLIAICSFLGRLSSGPASDYLVNQRGLKRHWNLILGLSLMLIGHLLNTLNLNMVSHKLNVINWYLSFCSCLIGYAYGFSFTTYPAIISDIFNMKNYSFLWGLMYSSTAFGLAVMNRLFGYIYDLHSKTNSQGEYVCYEGSDCYRQTFIITGTMCFAVIALLGIYIRKTTNPHS